MASERSGGYFREAVAIALFCILLIVTVLGAVICSPWLLYTDFRDAWRKGWRPFGPDKAPHEKPLSSLRLKLPDGREVTVTPDQLADQS